MENEIKKILLKKRTLLPILSGYWEIDVAENQNKKINEFKTVSKLHHTSKYLPHSLYKPISTSIDLTNFDE